MQSAESIPLRIPHAAFRTGAGFESRPLAKEPLLIGKLNCAIRSSLATPDCSGVVDLGSPVLIPDPWFSLERR
jgi:hypothetical protein